MAEFIHLIGAEDVQRAGHNMQSAATDMIRAASIIDESLCGHQIFMDDWLRRFEETLNTLNK